MNETIITVTGNLTDAPELRFTPNGAAVANFTVASTPRNFNRQSNEWEDGETLFVRCNAWKELGENAAATLTKGMRVIVQGTLHSRPYEDREGNKRTSWELRVDAVGPDLRFATAQVTRAQRGGGGGFGGGQQSAPPQQSWDNPQASGQDPWAGQSGGSWNSPGDPGF